MPDQRQPTAAVFRNITEVAVPGSVPRVAHPEWTSTFPWLCQGSTVPGPDRSHDMALFGASPSGEVQARWARLAESVGFPRVVHAHQVHGARVAVHEVVAAGRWVVEAFDGHATRVPGTLLTVATADCVPVSVVDPGNRAVALLHAGWRGTVAGVLEAGLSVLASALSGRVAACHVHLGPAICGDCYEVGPEVHQALGLPVPSEPTPVDLRRELARRAAAAGVPVQHLTVSSLCTRCGEAGLYSHRGGDRGRQVALLGVVPVERQ